MYMSDNFTVNSILSFFEEHKDVDSIEGMRKVGITPKKTYGLRIPQLTKLAKQIGKNHKLAQQLWEIDTRETRILACMIENPKTVSEKQIENWVNDFDYWEICDQCIMKLIEKTPFAYKKIIEWSKSNTKYMKRAGYVLLARLAFSDKKAENDVFKKYFSLIIEGATDNRRAVKLAVNWALRQIGKRNKELNREAINIAEKILTIETKSAQWVAKNALKELKSNAIQNKLS